MILSKPPLSLTNLSKLTNFNDSHISSSLTSNLAFLKLSNIDSLNIYESYETTDR